MVRVDVRREVAQNSTPSSPTPGLTSLGIGLILWHGNAPKCQIADEFKLVTLELSRRGAPGSVIHDTVRDGHVAAYIQE